MQGGAEGAAGTEAARQDEGGGKGTGRVQATVEVEAEAEGKDADEGYEQEGATEGDVRRASLRVRMRTGVGEG